MVIYQNPRNMYERPGLGAVEARRIEQFCHFFDGCCLGQRGWGCLCAFLRIWSFSLFLVPCGGNQNVR